VWLFIKVSDMRNFMATSVATSAPAIAPDAADRHARLGRQSGAARRILYKLVNELRLDNSILQNVARRLVPGEN
jgi:hypothetical protein